MIEFIRRRYRLWRLGMEKAGHIAAIEEIETNLRHYEAAKFEPNLSDLAIRMAHGRWHLCMLDLMETQVKLDLCENEIARLEAGEVLEGN